MEETFRPDHGADFLLSMDVLCVSNRQELPFTFQCTRRNQPRKNSARALQNILDGLMNGKPPEWKPNPTTCCTGSQFSRNSDRLLRTLREHANNIPG